MSDLDLGATIKGFAPGQKVFGRYVLKKILGRGGMGVVWLARDEELERDVALKFLPEIVALDKESLSELKRETRRNLELTHPHIVRVYDFVQGPGSAAISMEYVAGSSLSALKVDQPGKIFELAQLGPWLEQLCAALHHAHHDAKIVHRDLKPANLMVDAQGRIKITDFGIARSVADSVSRVSNQSGGSSGTPVYMSPQQMMGEDPAVADDIYALGATLYELLTGKPPFHSGNIMMQVQSKVPAPVNERRAANQVAAVPVPAAWEQTIAACLAKEAKDRPQSAAEVVERLGLTTKANSQHPTLNVERSSAEHTGRASRPDEPQPVERDLRARSEPARRSGSTPMLRYAGLAAGVLLLAGAGYYFGVYAPEQARLAEIKRLEARARTEADAKERTRLETEALKLKTEQERAAAETARLRTKQEKQDALAREQAAHLAAARGGIAIRTTPSGAEVRVGAIALDKSPLTLKDQKLGKYPVKVRADGYEDWAGEVEVKENDFAELEVTLIRSTGTVALSTDPAGLEAEIRSQKTEEGGQKVRTPGSLKLPTGRYEVTFRRPGWPEQKQTVAVTRNQSSTVTAEFAAGGLELTSTPAGAEVWQNGKRLGTTPFQLSAAIPGRYDFELKLKGYKAATTGVTVTARQTARENAFLEKLRGPETGQAWTIPELNLTLQPIAPGTFMMGSATSDLSNEKPVTRVTITRPFWLGRTGVTQAQYEALMGSNPSFFKGPDQPVEQLSWDEAMAFCRKLTEREQAAGRLPEGYAYTLPTEAQREYACRAGTSGDYAGNLDAMGWYEGNSGIRSEMHPVGQKQPNAWGLYDMHGNVYEWCLDWYGGYPGGSATDPTGPSSGSFRVLRGGGRLESATACRSAYRIWEPPGMRGDVSFRLALAPSRIK